MKKIYILEHFDFTEEQRIKLNKLGEIHYYEKANNDQINEAIQNAKVILIDWLDPEPILDQMHSGQFICLPYTGYDWIKNLEKAKLGG